MTDKAIRITNKFYNVAEDKQQLIKDIVAKNVEGKLDAYLKKISNKPDAEVLIDYKIQQNKQGRFETKFLFSIDGKPFIYSNKTAFKFVEDLVNHAFLHFKEHLSK